MELVEKVLAPGFLQQSRSRFHLTGYGLPGFSRVSKVSQSRFSCLMRPCEV